jgi:hypothetical protein
MSSLYLSDRLCHMLFILMIQSDVPVCTQRLPLGPENKAIKHGLHGVAISAKQNFVRIQWQLSSHGCMMVLLKYKQFSDQ